MGGGGATTRGLQSKREVLARSKWQRRRHIRVKGGSHKAQTSRGGGWKSGRWSVAYYYRGRVGGATARGKTEKLAKKGRFFGVKEACPF